MTKQSLRAASSAFRESQQIRMAATSQIHSTSTLAAAERCSGPSIRFMLRKAPKPSPLAIRGTISPSQIVTHWPDFTEQDTGWLIQRCWLQSSLATTRTKVCNGHGHILPQTQIRFFDQTPQKSCVLQFNAAICVLNHEFKIAS